MSRKVRLPQSRRHIWLYDEDWDFLTDWCAAHADLLTPGPAIRESIHARVLFLKARQSTAIDDSSQARFRSTETETESSQ